MLDKRQPPFKSLADLITRRADEQGDERGYVFLSDKGEEEAALTFGELHRRAAALAAQLCESGSPGERALLLFEAAEGRGRYRLPEKGRQFAQGDLSVTVRICLAFEAAQQVIGKEAMPQLLRFKTVAKARRPDQSNHASSTGIPLRGPVP